MKCHSNFYVRSINFLRWAQTTSHQHRYVWQDKTFHICLRTQIHLPRQHITNNRSGMAETIILQLAVFRRVSHHFVYIMLDYTGNIVVHITKHTHTCTQCGHKWFTRTRSISRVFGHSGKCMCMMKSIRCTMLAGSTQKKPERKTVQTAQACEFLCLQSRRCSASRGTVTTEQFIYCRGAMRQPQYGRNNRKANWNKVEQSGAPQRTSFIIHSELQLERGDNPFARLNIIRRDCTLVQLFKRIISHSSFLQTVHLCAGTGMCYPEWHFNML